MKSQIPVLKFLLDLEHVMNIHRDYFNLSKRKRILVSLCIVLETFLSAVILTICAEQLLKTNYKFISLTNSLIFLILYMLFGYLTMLYLGPKYTQSFHIILNFFNKGHILARRTLVYNKSLRNLNITLYIIITVYLTTRVVVFVLFDTINYYTENYLETTYDLFRYSTYIFLRTWVDIRYSLEMILFFSLVCILSLMVGHLAFLVKDLDTRTGKVTRQIGAFATMYQELYECRKQLMLCFGLQVHVSIAIWGIHVIGTMFKYIHFFVSNDKRYSMLTPSTLTSVVLYAIVFIAVASAGQRVRSECDNIRKHLAKLCCLTSKYSENENYKALKDFHRLVCVKPISVKLSVSAVPIGMYVVPAALSLSVNYIIVLLQFNNDV